MDGPKIDQSKVITVQTRSATVDTAVIARRLRAEGMDGIKKVVLQ